MASVLSLSDNLSVRNQCLAMVMQIHSRDSGPMTVDQVIKEAQALEAYVLSPTLADVAADAAKAVEAALTAPLTP